MASRIVGWVKPAEKPKKEEKPKKDKKSEK